MLGEESVAMEIERSAMRFLARREYSRQELVRKLLARSYSHDQVYAVLDSLQHRGFLSDTRFADLLVRSRIGGGYGPFKIKFELREKGVAETIIETTLSAFSVDWVALAKKAKEKRFGSQIPTDLNELSRQIRYLRNRGFYQEHLDLALPSVSFA